MKTLSIYNPVWVKDGMAYFSVSDYNFRKLGDSFGGLIIKVYQGNKMAGWNIIYKKTWISGAKLKERKVKLRPDEPLNFYYGIMPFNKMGLEEYKSREFVKSIY